MKRFQILPITLIAISCVSSVGCGKGEATATLQLQNTASFMAQSLAERIGSIGAASANPAGYITPASLKVKFIAAYLAEDVDPSTQNNVGNTQMFWLNSECNEDIGGCNADALTSFFDFTDPTAANTTLNSQGRTIETGTYRYVRLEFCKYGATGNVKVTAPAAASGGYDSANEVTLTYSGCGETSAPLNPPLELNDGDSVRVLLSYDLAHTINVTVGNTAGTSTYCTFDTPNSKTVCLGGLNFNPSVVR